MSLVKVKDSSGNIYDIPNGVYKAYKNVSGYTLVEEQPECKKPVVDDAVYPEIEETTNNLEVEVDGEVQQPKKSERKVNRKVTDKTEVQ